MTAPLSASPEQTNGGATNPEAVVLATVDPTKRRVVRARGKGNKKNKRHLWRYTAGDHGHAVTVLQKAGKKNLYIEWWSPKKADMERHSLGHADEEEAIKQARQLSDQIRLKTVPITGGVGEPSLVTLLHLYYGEHGQKLSGRQPAEHARRRTMWLAFFEQQLRPIVHPRDLDATLFNDFISDRRHGDLDVEGISLPEAAPMPKTKTMKRKAIVSDGTIDSDLIYLGAALNWATDYRVNGEPLLKTRTKVPRCKPQKGTLRQPVAAEDDLEALRPVLDAVDPQKLLRFWLELMNQYGWRVTGLSHVKASDIDFSPQPGAPDGRLTKNSTVDKERRNDWVALTPRIVSLLRELLALLGLEAGDDAYLFATPMSKGAAPWSRWHVGRLLAKAEKAAKIKHIGGLHAWRRKWHTERKNYPAVDVAKAAGYADTRSVDRYRHADPETTYRVVTMPTFVVRRGPKAEPTSTPAEGASEAVVSHDAGLTDREIAEAVATSRERPDQPAAEPPARSQRRLRRQQPKDAATPAPAAAGVGQGRGSAARAVMPDGKIVESRDERFAANLAVVQAYAAEHGHLLPTKHDRPDGVNLLMWLKNQEIQTASGKMPAGRRAELEAIPAWCKRMTKRGVVSPTA